MGTKTPLAEENEDAVPTPQPPRSPNPSHARQATGGRRLSSAPSPLAVDGPRAVSLSGQRVERPRVALLLGDSPGRSTVSDGGPGHDGTSPPAHRPGKRAGVELGATAAHAPPASRPRRHPTGTGTASRGGPRPLPSEVHTDPAAHARVTTRRPLGPAPPCRLRT